jgi:hypothetical protein
VITVRACPPGARRTELGIWDRQPLRSNAKLPLLGSPRRENLGSDGAPLASPAGDSPSDRQGRDPIDPTEAEQLPTGGPGQARLAKLAGPGPAPSLGAPAPGRRDRMGCGRAASVGHGSRWVPLTGSHGGVAAAALPSQAAAARQPATGSGQPRPGTGVPRDEGAAGAPLTRTEAKARAATIDAHTEQLAKVKAYCCAGRIVRVAHARSPRRCQLASSIYETFFPRSHVASPSSSRLCTHCTPKSLLFAAGLARKRPSQGQYSIGTALCSMSQRVHPTAYC